MEFKEEAKVTCPVCGFDYVHPISVRCVPAGAAGGSITVTAHGIHRDRRDSVDGRGVVIELGFSCEGGHIFTQGFTFHKGQTFVNVDDITRLVDVEPAPITIWRN